MAQYKACCPVIAPIVSEKDGEITYGPGMVLDRMMNVKVTPEYDSPVIYADDDVAEHTHLHPVTYGVNQKQVIMTD